MLADTESIQELTSIIATNAAKVESYLEANGLPKPSFAVDGPSASQIPQHAEDIENARLIIIDATQRLRLLMLGPHDYITSHAPNDLVSLQAISRFNIASFVPIDGSATFAEIAAKCGLSESMTRRLLLHATVRNVFCRVGDDRVAHNAVSRLIAERPNINAWLYFNTSDNWHAASQVAETLVKWPGSEEPNETAFSLSSGTGQAMYEYYDTQPERGQRFSLAMETMTQSPGYDAIHLVKGYDWGSLKSGVVVDLGGSHGEVARRVTAAFPELTFVVQDLPETTATNASRADDRVSFMSHNFFEPQPLEADVYLFRWIMHNWSDKYCVRIFRALIPALKPGARVIVNEFVLPSTNVGGGSQWKEERQRAADLIMFHNFNSKERTLEDWATLFEMADPRLRFKGVNQPFGSRLSVLEAVWEA